MATETKKSRGKPFTKGDPRAGRPKGVQNKTTVEVRELASRLVTDPDYLENLEIRLKTGEAAPAVEAMLWHYAHGKPVDKVELTGPGGGPVAMRDETQRLTSEEQRRVMAELVAGARARIGQAEAEPPAVDEAPGEPPAGGDPDQPAEDEP